MAKIDTGKLISDFLSYKHKIDDNSPFKYLNRNEKRILGAAVCLVSMALNHALKEQGIEFKHGELIKEGGKDEV